MSDIIVAINVVIAGSAVCVEFEITIPRSGKLLVGERGFQGGSLGNSVRSM